MDVRYEWMAYVRCDGGGPRERTQSEAPWTRGTEHDAAQGGRGWQIGLARAEAGDSLQARLRGQILRVMFVSCMPN